MSYEPDPPTDTQIESEAEDRWWAEQCCEHSLVFHAGERCDADCPDHPVKDWTDHVKWGHW